MSILIKYKDIALGAKENFSVEVSANIPASNIDLLKQDGIKFKRYDIPFELNSMILDGGAEFLPESELAIAGFISKELSNEQSKFDVPIVFTLTSPQYYTSAGLAIVFDEQKNIFATRINIKWYRDDKVLFDKDFYPTSPNYFCDNKVEFYNKIIITFYSLNVPNNRLRVNAIEYGLNVEFSGQELKSAKIIQEIDPISTSIPINPFDFTIDSKKDIEFSFQTKQPIEVYFNDKLRATTFVKTAKRISQKIWSVESEDYIGLMDTIYFKGGIFTNKNAKELISEIFDVAKVPFEIEDDFEIGEVTGFIPYVSCRQALMQVCFAIQAVADTSNADKVKIFSLKNDVIQFIEKNRIMQGQSFEEEARVTAVELTSHTYKEIEDVLVAYEAEKSGVGEKIFVSFSDPLHNLAIENGKIIESNVNYAIIDADENCVLQGQKYEHTTVKKQRKNPLVLSTDIENIVAIENATLVSANNVDKLLEICYDYIVRINKTNMKIIDGKNDTKTVVGDFIKYDTEYLGEKQGRIIKQSFNLNGGALVKDSVVR